jgi:hypothetical protein
MHELFTLEEIIGDVNKGVIVEAVAQKLKISHHSSLDMVVCPFLEGM